VDEVNLLPDHLVDLLLDVASSGINHIERDGLSHSHPARFVLIGTMNPEEGELRPQLLDRFGLKVQLGGTPEPAQRAEIVRRRLAFDDAPEAFLAQWQNEQDALRQRCTEARLRLSDIPLDNTSLDAIAQRCFAAAVDGLRADLVWLRGARAHAAWRGASRIQAQDIDALEPFVLAHRRREHTPLASQPPAPNPSEQQPSQQDQGEGQWGALPPQAVAVGERREPPTWPKKP
jgi:magnesium chelatase subunit I